MIRLQDWIEFSRYYQDALHYLYGSEAQKLLSQMRDYHMGTFNHMIRVGFLSGYLAYAAQAESKEVKDTIIAGTLHDIGKLNIPLRILDKPGRLTDVEMLEIQKHPSIGAELVKKCLKDENIITGIYQHHEKADGTGYYGIRSVSNVADRVCIADVYDALTENRSYRGKLTEGSAMNILRDMPRVDTQNLVQLDDSRFLDLLWESVLIPSESENTIVT